MEAEIEKTRTWPKILIWVVIVIFILAAIGANVYAEKLKNAETISADQLKTKAVKGRTMKDTLIASGEVVPADLTKVYRDPSKGAVAKIFVKQGDKVKKGDKLFRYDETDTQNQLDSLKIKKQQDQMQIDHYNKKINDLAQQITEAEDGNVSDKTTGSKNEHEPDKTVATADKHASDKTIESLKQQKDDAEFQVEQSQLDLKQVDGQIDGARKKLDNLTVKSKLKGIVESVSKEPGGDASEAVVTVVSNQPYEIHGTLSEYDVVHVKKGQAVSVKPRALKGRKWKGTIKEVGDAPVENALSNKTDSNVKNANATSYSFTAKLKGKTDDLRRGYHVNAEIVIDEHKDAPVLPFDAITSDHNKKYAFIVKKGKIHRQQVHTGLVNGKWKEIKKGVQIGDKIVLHPSSKLKDGMKVVSRDDQAK